MRNLKGLLIASVVATAIVGLPAYSQNARANRSENLQKRETLNTDTKKSSSEAKRPGFSQSRPSNGGGIGSGAVAAPAQRPSNGGGIGSGAVAAPARRPSNGGGIGSGAVAAPAQRPSNGGGIGSGATAAPAPSGSYNNSGRRPGNSGGGIGSGAGVAPAPTTRPGGIGGGAVPAPGGSYDNNSGRRPGNSGGGIGSGAVPAPGGSYDNNSGRRPGHNGGGIGSGAAPSRPGYGGGSVSRPGNDHPSGYYNNDRNYDRGYYNGRHVAPPARPYRPYCRPVPRPVCPPSYRPYASARYIDNILGLAFGVTYIASLDYLYDNGYSVDGYDNNVVYLRNVNEMSYNWPDATLNYDNGGQLANMQFTYSTSYRSTSRYDRLYRELCRYYGSPVTYSRNANGVTGVWYGGGQRNYVSLEYAMEYVNGSVRYYTILSYGY